MQPNVMERLENCRFLGPTSRDTDTVELKWSSGINFFFFFKATLVILMQSEVWELLFREAFSISPLPKRGKGGREKEDYLLVLPELHSHVGTLSRLIICYSSKLT